MGYVLFEKKKVVIVRSFLVTPPKSQLPPSSQHHICFIFSSYTLVCYIFFFLFIVCLQNICSMTTEIFVYFSHKQCIEGSLQRRIITLKELAIGLVNKVNTGAIVLDFLTQIMYISLTLNIFLHCHFNICIIFQYMSLKFVLPFPVSFIQDHILSMDYTIINIIAHINLHYSHIIYYIPKK